VASFSAAAETAEPRPRVSHGNASVGVTAHVASSAGKIAVSRPLRAGRPWRGCSSLLKVGAKDPSPGAIKRRILDLKTSLSAWLAQHPPRIGVRKRGFQLIWVSPLRNAIGSVTQQ